MIFLTQLQLYYQHTDHLLMHWFSPSVICAIKFVEVMLQALMSMLQNIN